MIGATVRGKRDLRAGVDRVVDNVAAELDDAVRAEARDVLIDELDLVPVETGELLAGIEVWFDRESGDLVAFVGIRDTDLYWAVWIEWGRKNAAAIPFATPASELARKRWPKHAEKALKKGVRR